MVLLFNHHHDTGLSTSLRNFQYRIRNFVDQKIFLKTKKDSKSFSLQYLHDCFKLIDTTNGAFSKMVVEIDYPMGQWGGKAIDEYLSYSLNVLNLLNLVSSSISHLNQAKISVFHAVKLMKATSTYSTCVPIINFRKDDKVKSCGIQKSPVSDRKERLIVQALMVLKKIEFLAFGFVLSGLCSDVKPYLEIRNLFPGGFVDNPLIETVDLRFCEEIMKIQGGIEEVNCIFSSEIFVGRRRDENEASRKLEKRLKKMDESIQEIEKEVNKLFFELTAARNKLLDNIRFHR